MYPFFTGLKLDHGQSYRKQDHDDSNGCGLSHVEFLESQLIVHIKERFGTSGRAALRKDLDLVVRLQGVDHRNDRKEKCHDK